MLGKSCQIQNQTYNGIIFPSATACSCCETCLRNLVAGEDCSIGLPGAPLPDAICGGGLYCKLKPGNQHPTCEPMLETSPCFKAQFQFDNDLDKGLIGHLQQRPSCDGNGFYSPIICIPGQNCFCINESGQRIFGNGLFKKNVNKIMTCECSRLNNKLKELIAQKFPYFTTRCKPDGSFEPLQCFGELCVCVDTKTGSPTSETRNLTKGLQDMPCYDIDLYKDPFVYTKPCDNIKQGRINNYFDAKRNGEETVDFETDICDPDGSFIAVQQDEVYKYCVDQYDIRIEHYVVNKTSQAAQEMNCKCARVQKLLKDHNYLEIPQCCPNGNYNKLACRRGQCYCVDIDGKQVSIEVIYIYKHKLPCYNNECFT